MAKQRVVTEPEKQMRGKIIALLVQLGYTDEKGNADFQAINNYIQEIGSRNPRRQILNYLYHHELVEVLTQVQERYNKQFIQ